MLSSRTVTSRIHIAATCLAALTTSVARGDEPVERPLIRTVPRATQEAAPSGEPATPEHPLRPAIRIAQASLEQLEPVRDYEAILTKRERINGELQQEVMRIKFREEPFSVYLSFGGANAGREVLYVEGRNQNNILAHEGSGLKSLVGTVSLSPTSPEVLAASRHSITDIGLQNLLRFIIDRWEAEAEFGEVQVQYYHNAKLGERACLAIECTHPHPRRQFRFHMTRLYIDKETQFPVRVENYGFPMRAGAAPPLEEEYTYSNLRINVGLTGADFDRNNPNYSF